MKFAICNEIFQPWPVERGFKFAAEVGYHAVEIAPFTISKYVTDISPEQRLTLRRQADSAGVAISGLHWVLAFTEGFHLTHPDPAIRSKTSDYLTELVTCCADLGGQSIVVGSPKQRNLDENTPFELGWARALDVFRPMIRAAEAKQITVCFEPLAPSETNFINTAEKAIQFTQALQSDRFKIILDVKAMSSESKPIPQIIHDSSPHFRYFHANDRNLKGPGFGDTDFHPIAKALKEVGYNGYVSVEVFNFDEGPEVIATQSIKYLRSVFESHPA